VIPHRTSLVEASADRRLIRLRSLLDDGVVVNHEIRVEYNAVDFRVDANNPTDKTSQAHWAQPCIRVDRFTGTKAVHGSEAYLPSCFIFVGDKLTRMPTAAWAREARYTPGQVWCPEAVSRNDVNPRPLSSIVPSNGLIGCFSADGKEILATAWEPYQELFQGVIVCLHSDFRIGGLKPGESRSIRGKIYLGPADVEGLLARYRHDFPEHKRELPRGYDGTRPRKLIEFGWDEPDLRYLLKNQAAMERSPFDGCVFHVNTSGAGKDPESLTWRGWSRREFKLEEFKDVFMDVISRRAKGRFGPMKKAFDDNFLRFNVTPADLDWFDDYSAVIANAQRAASFSCGSRGILLDTEQYEGQLFDFKKQRDASRRGWEAYAEQARRRGREIMTAFQEGHPDLTLMLTFGPSLVWNESRGGTKPLEECRYGLLVPFVDGLIDAVKGNSEIVDGFEPSYGYREPASFEKAFELMTRKAPGLMSDPPAYRRIISAGFGLWLDYDWRKKGWKTDTIEANYFSPERFQTALRSALYWSDEYVWIYTEKPRWWTSDGKLLDLPDAYVQAIRRAREGYCRD
jgi:hypothetical protein